MNCRGIVFRVLLTFVIVIIGGKGYSQQLDQKVPEFSPQSNWTLLFNKSLLPTMAQPWGIESDGNFIYVSTPFASGYRFSKFTLNGTWIQNFNLQGLNNISIRDMCFDGNYWWGIEYGNPSRIHRIDFDSGVALNSITLAAPLAYSYSIVFDQDLASGNGGFYIGTFDELFIVDINGTLIGTIPQFSSLTSGYHYFYGLAMDYCSSPGTKILWIGDLLAPGTLHGFNLNTNTWPSGLVQPIPGTSGNPNSGTYGLSESALYEPGSLTLLGVGLGSNGGYQIFGAQICTASGITVSNPADATVIIGDTALFSVVANGPGPFTYQWQASSNGGSAWVNLTNGGQVSGVNTPNLSVYCTNMILNQTIYRCLVSGSSYSISALLTILTPSINGKVVYANSGSTPIPNCTVLLKQSSLIVAQTNTNNLGEFVFPSFYPGTYTLDIQVSKPWGGVNSADALRIAKHVAGITPLTGLPLVAADVNLSNTVNSIDALMVAQRAVGIINAFPAGNWVTESPGVTFVGAGIQNVNIKVLCTGDVNGSYVP